MLSRKGAFSRAGCSTQDYECFCRQSNGMFFPRRWFLFLSSDLPFFFRFSKTAIISIAFMVWSHSSSGQPTKLSGSYPVNVAYWTRTESVCKEKLSGKRPIKHRCATCDVQQWENQVFEPTTEVGREFHEIHPGIVDRSSLL